MPVFLTSIITACYILGRSSICSCTLDQTTILFYLEDESNFLTDLFSLLLCFLLDSDSFIHSFILHSFIGNVLLWFDIHTAKYTYDEGPSPVMFTQNETRMQAAPRNATSPASQEPPPPPAPPCPPPSLQDRAASVLTYLQTGLRRARKRL